MRRFSWCKQALMVAVIAIAAARLPAADEPVRVMTFNVRYGTANDGENSWPKRKELLLATIRKFDPDLLGMQEVLALQVDYLVENLKDYSLVGVGRDDGKRRGEFSPVMFRAKRFEAVDSGTFWLSETPDKPGSKSWDSALPRIATWIKLRDHHSGDREICFINTHWDHVGDRARTESGKMIRRWLADHAQGTSAIVTGDFNVTDSHAGHRALVSPDESGPRLFDVYNTMHAAPGPNAATFHGFSGRTRGRPIDHILATPDWTASEASIDRTHEGGRYPSDHYPMTAVLGHQK